MQNPNFNENRFIDLREFLSGSLLLEPYKEEVGHFLGEQFLIAVELWQDGRVEEALPIFDELYEITPNFFIHKFIRLGDRIENEESHELLSELDKIDYNRFIENLDKFFYKLARAILYFKQLDIDEAIDECREAISIIKDFSPIYILLGDCLMLRNNYHEAIKNYKIALKANYKINHVKANLAYAYLMLHKDRKARKLFKEVVDEFPDNFKIQYNMALSYLRKKKYDLTLKYLDRVEKLNQDFSGLHLTRGGVYLKQNKLEEAIKSFQKASELGSENAENILKKLMSK